MLNGKNLLYINAEKLEGVSKNSGLPYSFCNITLSDGLQDFTLNLDENILFKAKDLKRGDKVNIDVDIIKRGQRLNFTVIGLALSTDTVKV